MLYNYDVSRKKKYRKMTLEKKKNDERKEKVKRKKNSKAKNVHVVKEVVAYVRMKEKWVKKMKFAHIFGLCSTSLIDSL